jgi:hypothetical protein
MTSRTAIAAAMRTQAQALLALADAIETDAPAEQDPIVDVVEHARAVPRRSVLSACRAGAIDGASKKGKHWLARKSEVDRWLQTSTRIEAANDGDTSPAAYLRQLHSMRAGGQGR